MNTLNKRINRDCDMLNQVVRVQLCPTQVKQNQLSASSVKTHILPRNKPFHTRKSRIHHTFFFTS